MKSYDLLMLSEEQIEDMVQSGVFNTIIQGYCITAMKQAGFTEADIEKLDFPYLFDSTTAWSARKAAQKHFNNF